MKKTILLAIAPFLLAASTSQAAISFSDDFTTNSLASYSIPTGSSNITYGATAGINGGGGVVIANAPTVNPSISFIPGAAAFNTAFTLGAGEKVTMTMMLKYSGSQGGTSQAFLGLSNGQDYSWGANTIGTTSAVGGAVTTGINLSPRGGTSGATNNVSGGLATQGNATLITNNWYLHQVELTKPLGGSNLWQVNESLQNFGLNGITPGAVVLSYAGQNQAFGTTADVGINAIATSTFLNFGVRSQMWTAADSFTATSVIPEPSTYATLALGALGLFGLNRLRGNRKAS